MNSSARREDEDGMDPQDLGSLPPGFPRDYQRLVILQDGRQVFIRPILPRDAPELADAIKTADAATLRDRFLGGPPPVTPALLAYLTNVDYLRRFALVAIDQATGRGVGIARYEQTGDEVAEVAVVVSPAWRHAGLAAALVSILAEAALARGIGTFTASSFARNRPVAALAREADGPSRQVIKQGIAEFSVDLEHHDTKATDSTGDPEHVPR